MENLSLSVPDLLRTVKKFVPDAKHNQLDQMLSRYLNKELGKQQVRPRTHAHTRHPTLTTPITPLRCASIRRAARARAQPPSPPRPLSPLTRLTPSRLNTQLQIELRSVAGRDALRQALLAMVPQIDELQKRREQLKFQQLQAGGSNNGNGFSSSSGVKLEQPPTMPPLAGAPSTASDAAINGKAAAAASSSGGGSSSAATAGAPGASTARKSTLPVQALVHAFHCTDDQCTQKSCHETKLVLKRMKTHVEGCNSRAKAAAAGEVAPECKVCKLWQALHRTRNSSGSGAKSLATGSSSGAGSSSQTSDGVRQKLRQLDPAQVKRMLLQHVRSCTNKQCHTCHKLRERIKASRAAAGVGGMGGFIADGRPRVPGMGGGGLGMEGSTNILMGGNPMMGGMSGFFAGGAAGAAAGMGALGGGAYPHVGGHPFGVQQQGGQRRNKVKQRGRENIAPGRAWTSRQTREPAPRYTRIRIKLRPMRGHVSSQRAEKRSAKRKSMEAEAAAAKRAKRDAAAASRGKGGVGADDDDMVNGIDQCKPAPGRSEDLALNYHVPDSHVEVRTPEMDDWRLAVVRSASDDGVYTVQYEPVDSNRAKVPNISHSHVRMACSHPDCRVHDLTLAALPLFCDRCRKALMSTPQQRIYYQETVESAAAVDSPTCLRLCTTCVGSLRAELRSKGQAGIDAEVQKFTRELPQGSERTTLPLNQLEEMPLPTRSLDSDAPVLSQDTDARWVQCGACFQWWHWTCAMYNDNHYKGGRTFYCRGCKGDHEKLSDEVRELLQNNDSENLTQIPMGEFIEEQVANDMQAAGIKSEHVSIRIVSSLLMTSYAPERLVEHTQALGEHYPKEFPYKSKALLAFQKCDGLDVCLFALYVQEYGSDCPEPNKNRVYISYLDSVRYFESEPRGHRSTLYHAVLVAYLQWTRMLGFKYVHIWVEPPKMGDEYIFFARPDQQRKPMKREKLREWYRIMLDKAKAKGIVERYGTMHDLFNGIKTIADIPLFHGDQWEMTVPSLLGVDQDDYAEKKAKNELVRMDSKDVLQKAHQEMQHLKRHFLVVVFNDPDGEPLKDEDPVISSDLTDSRQSFLGQCQMCHWQFNTLRHAQYSTMMLLNHIHHKPSYCIEECSRGRVEDGSFMICCDMCDNWFHGDCIGISKELANTMESYLCPKCQGVEGASTSVGSAEVA